MLGLSSASSPRFPIALNPRINISEATELQSLQSAQFLVTCFRTYINTFTHTYIYMHAYTHTLDGLNLCVFACLILVHHFSSFFSGFGGGSVCSSIAWSTLQGICFLFVSSNPSIASHSPRQPLLYHDHLNLDLPHSYMW